VFRCAPSLPLCCGFAVLATALSVAAAEPDAAAPKHPFDKNVQVTFTNDLMIVRSDGIPTHQTGDFPNRDNPNRILKQDYTFKIPLKPRVADHPTPTPMGPIGVAINGIPFYNERNREGQDAVKLEVFDSCCGHPDPMGRYHYHKYPVCVKSPFKSEAGKHSPLIGYAFDGFPIYGPNDVDGRPPTNLDECNGHADAERGYHYHVTAGPPYIIGMYRGVVEPGNLERPRGGPPPGGGPKGKRPPPSNGGPRPKAR
jgi:hypothetical protein